MKLSRFSYQMGEAKGVKMGCEECKAKYAVENPLLRSLMPELAEKEKLLLSDIDSDDKVFPCEDDSAPRVEANLTVDSANPSVELEGINVVISTLVAEEKNFDGINL